MIEGRQGLMILLINILNKFNLDQKGILTIKSSFYSYLKHWSTGIKCYTDSCFNWEAK